MIRLTRPAIASLRLLAATACVIAFAAHSSAAGYYNVPSNFRQCVGCGFGAGYHSQLTLQPAWKGSAASPGVRRARPAVNAVSDFAEQHHRSSSRFSLAHHHRTQALRVNGSHANPCQGPALPATIIYNEVPAYAPAPIMAPGPALFAAPPLALPQPQDAPDDEPDSPSDTAEPETLPSPTG